GGADTTSPTARLNAGSFAFDGLVKPLSFRTNCRADARTSASVAGGLKLCRVLMFRHMGAPAGHLATSALSGKGSVKRGERGPAGYALRRLQARCGAAAGSHLLRRLRDAAHHRSLTAQPPISSQCAFTPGGRCSTADTTSLWWGDPSC